MTQPLRRINMPETDYQNEAQVYHHVALGCHVASCQSRKAPDRGRGAHPILWAYAASNIAAALDRITEQVPPATAAITANLAQEIIDHAPEEGSTDAVRKLTADIQRMLERVAFTHGVGPETAPHPHTDTTDRDHA